MRPPVLGGVTAEWAGWWLCVGEVFVLVLVRGTGGACLIVGSAGHIDYAWVTSLAVNVPINSTTTTSPSLALPGSASQQATTAQPGPNQQPARERKHAGSRCPSHLQASSLSLSLSLSGRQADLASQGQEPSQAGRQQNENTNCTAWHRQAKSPPLSQPTHPGHCSLAHCACSQIKIISYSLLAALFSLSFFFSFFFLHCC